MRATWIAALLTTLAAACTELPDDSPPAVGTTVEELEGELCLRHDYDAEISCDTYCGRCITHCFETKCPSGRGDGGCSGEVDAPGCPVYYYVD